MTTKLPVVSGALEIPSRHKTWELKKNLMYISLILYRFLSIQWPKLHSFLFDCMARYLLASSDTKLSSQSLWSRNGGKSYYIKQMKSTIIMFLWYVQHYHVILICFFVGSTMSWVQSLHCKFFLFSYNEQNISEY